jgi:cation:H+ antiporter
VIESLGIILLATILIWWFSERLESVANVIGSHLRMPESVKGAVLYAIPSSFPELATATLAVIALDEPVFEVGVGTIVGSAVFNLLVIPALALIAAAAYMKKRGRSMNAINISPEVFLRDGVFYLFVVLLFIGVVLTGTFSKVFAWVFLGLYGLYVYKLYRVTKKHRRDTSKTTAVTPEDADRMSLARASIWLVLSTFMIGLACYFLVEQTIVVSEYLAINPYVVAVILTAAATSIPDTIISVAAAKQSGEDSEAAIVNAFSSNIFDVLVCLSVPTLLFPGELHIKLSDSIVSLVLLAVMTFVTLAMIRVGNRVTKTKAYILLAMYAVFVVCAVLNTPIIEWLGLEFG